MRYLVGGRFACLSCLQRSVSRECLRCADESDVVDLDDERGRWRVSMARAAGQLGTRPRGFWDPRVLRLLPDGRRVLWLGSRIAFVLGFVSLLWTRTPIAPPISAQVAFATRGLMALVAGFAASGAWIALVALAVLTALGIVGIVAKALSLLAGALGLFAKFTPEPISRWASTGWLRLTVAAERDVLRAALAWVERSFVARLRAGDVRLAADAPRLEGYLRWSGGAPIVAISEDSGTIEVRDARAHPFEVETADGTRITVDIASGAVETHATGTPSHDVTTLPLFPSWASIEEDRRAQARVVRVQSGARVLVEGGVWVDELDPTAMSATFRSAPSRRVLRGQADAPLTVKVL